MPENADERKLRDQRVSELSARKEALEGELAQKSAPFRKIVEPLTSERLQRLLPPKTALVDLLEYTHTLPDPANMGTLLSSRHLAAFVVRADREVAFLDLGPVEPLGESIATWRSSLGQGKSAIKAGQRIRQQVWEPLLPYFENIETVLVSPDGVISTFPLVALPGKDPDTYMLEEDLRIAVIPSAVLLPEILEADRAAGAAPSLLAVGGVDYEGATAATSPAASDPLRPRPEDLVAVRSIVRGPDGVKFSFLPGAEQEIDLLQRVQLQLPADRQGKLAALRGREATETAFKVAAPQHRFLHLATHGYFAPAEVKSALDSARQPADRMVRYEEPQVIGHHPGLLSGLAFAGANQVATSGGEDDGVLTAEEVSTLTLDRTDMVVLSACETGLGRTAGGEGLLGLQRAFQISGAKTVVASLWAVPDEATRDLMVRFYRNQWEHGMSKSEALREAQLSLLRTSDPVQRQSYRDARLRPDAEAISVTKGVPPLFWAAWVLSGDWR